MVSMPGSCSFTHLDGADTVLLKQKAVHPQQLLVVRNFVAQLLQVVSSHFACSPMHFREARATVDPNNNAANTPVFLLLWSLFMLVRSRSTSFIGSIISCFCRRSSFVTCRADAENRSLRSLMALWFAAIAKSTSCTTGFSSFDATSRISRLYCSCSCRSSAPRQTSQQFRCCRRCLREQQPVHKFQCFT